VIAPEKTSTDRRKVLL